VTAKMIDCKITNTTLTLGIKGNPPYINVWSVVCKRNLCLFHVRVV
jgi:hypothetical protein